MADDAAHRARELKDATSKQESDVGRQWRELTALADEFAQTICRGSVPTNWSFKARLFGRSQHGWDVERFFDHWHLQVFADGRWVVVSPAWSTDTFDYGATILGSKVDGFQGVSGQLRGFDVGVARQLLVEFIAQRTT